MHKLQQFLAAVLVVGVPGRLYHIDARSVCHLTAHTYRLSISNRSIVVHLASELVERGLSIIDRLDWVPM